VPNAVLLISCPDRPGLVAAVASFVADHGGNIVHAEQHVDAALNVFFQRVEFELEGFGVERQAIARAFAPVAERHGMTFDLRFTDTHARIGLLASREPHCLVDVLARTRSGDLGAEVVAVISNHDTHADLAAFYGVPYVHLPVTAQTKPQQESDVIARLRSLDVDLVVLARYMQILSPAFIDAYRHRIINIHHSFLPAFVGAKPYHQAHGRGVKIIGVTAHYATEDLDQGPIIEQDVVRVSHRDAVADLVRKGRDLETVVLARAIRLHVEHRVLIYGNKTVVFT